MDGNVLQPRSKKLETEPCKRSDINFEGDENEDAYKFWTPNESFSTDIDRFMTIF